MGERPPNIMYRWDRTRAQVGIAVDDFFSRMESALGQLGFSCVNRVKREREYNNKKLSISAYVGIRAVYFEGQPRVIISPLIDKIEKMTYLPLKLVS